MNSTTKPHSRRLLLVKPMAENALRHEAAVLEKFKQDVAQAHKALKNANLFKDFSDYFDKKKRLSQFQTAYKQQMDSYYTIKEKHDHIQSQLNNPQQA